MTFICLDGESALGVSNEQGDKVTGSSDPVQRVSADAVLQPKCIYIEDTVERGLG